MEWTTPIPVEDTFDALYGLEIVEFGDDLIRARVPVRTAVMQPFGLVHGGIVASMAESVASIGTYAAVAKDGKVAMGLSNQTSFLRPITKGTIRAVARPRHRGRTSWLWDVEILDDADRLCAVSRMTIAVRDAPPAQPR
jgi:uncharacterized protein (TIGR00369 family)